MRSETNVNDVFPSEDDFLDEMDRTLVAERRRRIFRGLLLWFCVACLAGLMINAFGHVSVNLVEATDGASGLPAGSLVIAQQKRGESTGKVLRFTDGGSLHFQRGSKLTAEQTAALFRRGQMQSAAGFVQAFGLGLPVLLLGILVIIIREIFAVRRYQMPEEAYE